MPEPLIRLLIDDKPAPATLLDRVRRIEVRESDDEPTTLALQFQLTQKPDGSFAVLDEDTLTPGTTLAMEIAAPGGRPQRLFHGYLSHVRPHFESIESNCHLELLAFDAAMVLDAHERTASYPNASDADVVAEILRPYNITGMIEHTAEVHQEDRKLLVQRGTDWQFLRQLARHNGYLFYFEYDEKQQKVVAHFCPRPLSDEPQADLTILQPDANLHWLDLQWVLTGPTSYSGVAIDPLLKQLVSSKGEAKLTSMGKDGLADSIDSALSNLGAGSGGRLLRSSRTTSEGIQAEGTGATDAVRFMIEAKGEIDSSLYRGLLRARRTVLIRGAGKRFSGLYYVRLVRTCIEEGSLSQTFVADRNALGQTGLEEFGRSAEEVPAQ